MACTDAGRKDQDNRVVIHEALLHAIGNAVLKQRTEIDIMHSTIHELGNTVLKQCEEHVRVRADNAENVELLHRAFGFPCAGSTKFAPLTQLPPFTHLPPLKQPVIDTASMTDDIAQEGRASKFPPNSEEYLVEKRLRHVGYARPDVLKPQSAVFKQPDLDTASTASSKRANAELVRSLRDLVCNNTNSFHYRTTCDGRVIHFNFIFLDHNDYRVICGNIPSDFNDYPRAKALCSLILDRTFRDVEAFAVACENALGTDIAGVALAGKIVSDTDVSSFCEVFPTDV
jgi:hypothetical protein